jgi:hypothetical protein
MHARTMLATAPLVLATVVLWTGAAAGQLVMPFTNTGVAADLQYSYDSGGFSEWFYSGGGATGDFDRDGWQDVFGLGGGQGGVADKLFMNDQDGTFTDEAAAWGVAVTHKGKSASVADFNADGLLDIYVASAGPPGGSSGIAGQHRLYKNIAGSSFSNVSGSAGVNFSTSGTGDGWGSCWGDYDLDGDLDLFLAGFKNNNLGSRLFQNNGDETFTDVTDIIGLWSGTGLSIKAFAPTFADMDGDLYPELLISADFGTMCYFKNDGDGTFTDITAAAGLTAAENGMGGTVRDFDNDGLKDWYVTSIYWPSIGWTGNKLHINESTGPGDHDYGEIAGAAGVFDGGYGWGTVGVDFNHDGLMDIAETNGDSGGGGQFFQEQSYLWLQKGDGTYSERAIQAGLTHAGKGRGMLNLDYDNDGDQDLVIFANDEPVTLWRNDLIDLDTAPQGLGMNWVRVFLDTSARPELPPDGYGSTISVDVGVFSTSRNLDGGDNFLSQSELSCHFGLGNFGVIDELTVTWADGSHTTLYQVPANQTITIEAHEVWLDLGGAKTGTNGLPSLVGEGPMTGGDLVSLEISDGLAFANAHLVMGLTNLSAPFKGGTLVPNPDWIITPFPLDGSGGFLGLFPWPLGLPAGIDSFYQFWISDPGATVNLSATNGLQATTP